VRRHRVQPNGAVEAHRVAATSRLFTMRVARDGPHVSVARVRSDAPKRIIR